MISTLKGWSLKSASPSSIEYSWRVNGWSSAMIARISASMRLQVVVTEVRAAGQFEVVVEAVGDRRTDRVVRARATDA